MFTQNGKTFEYQIKMCRQKWPQPLRLNKLFSAWEICVAEAFNIVLRNTEVTSVYETKSAAFAQTFEYIFELRVLEHTRINITNLDLGTKQLWPPFL